MTPFQERCLTICRSCPYKQRRCIDGQPCLCTADGVDIHEHAKSGKCPEGMYPKADAASSGSGNE